MKSFLYLIFKPLKYLIGFTLVFLVIFSSKKASATPQGLTHSPARAMTPSIQKNDVIKNKRLLPSYKTQISMTKSQFETCVGLILGDANMQTQDQGKSYRLKFEVGEKNFDYLLHIKDCLDPFVLGEPNEIVRINKKGNQVKTYQLQTISHPDFNDLAKGFKISEGRKSIDCDFLNKELTPRAMAYWFMDDGGKLDYSRNKGKGIVFNTQGFKPEEVQTLCNILETKFGYKTWVKTNKGKPIIAISGKDYEDLTESIYSYIIPSMQHKWPEPRKPRKS